MLEKSRAASHMSWDMRWPQAKKEKGGKQILAHALFDCSVSSVHGEM